MIVKKIIKNAGFLTSAKGIESVLGVISISLTARFLGVEQLGLLALIQAYVMTIDGLVNFQSWPTLIKYGTESIANKEHNNFKSLMKLGFFADSGSSIVGTIISIIFIFLIGSIWSWDTTVKLMAILYSFTILFHINGTPTAILRIFDKFGLIAKIQVISSLILLCGIFLASLIDGQIWSFIIAYTIATITGHILLITASLIELKKQGYYNIFQQKIKTITNKYPAIWSFMWLTNINSSFRLAIKQIDILIVGLILGTGPTGLYKIAKQGTQGIHKMITTISQASYPDLTRIWAKKRYKEFYSLLKYIVTILISFGLLGWIIFFLLGESLISIVFGKEFINAYWVFTWYLLGSVIALSYALLGPSMLAIGKPKITLFTHIIATTIYFPTLYILTKTMNLPGAGIAYIIYQLIFSVIMWIFMIYYLNRFINLNSNKNT